MYKLWICVSNYTAGSYFSGNNWVKFTSLRKSRLCWYLALAHSHRSKHSHPKIGITCQAPKYSFPILILFFLKKCATLKPFNVFPFKEKIWAFFLSSVPVTIRPVRPTRCPTFKTLLCLLSFIPYWLFLDFLFFQSVHISKQEFVLPRGPVTLTFNNVTSWICVIYVTANKLYVDYY